MKTLYVGDVHATVEELEDCRNLIDLVLTTIQEYQPDKVVFLGDLYHTHAVVNVEVQAFWLRAFQDISAALGVNGQAICLVGNHDKPGDKNLRSHALQVHRNVTVVSAPTELDGTLYLPYIHDPKAFLVAVQDNQARNLVCHQTFTGAKYENGFFAKDGVDLDLVPQAKVIAGHIHTPMQIGKVQYFGSPRWRIVTDANTERFLNLVEDEKVVKIPTLPYLKAIWQITESAGDTTKAEELFSQTKPQDRVLVNLQGPQLWCDQRKKEVMGARPGVRIRTFPTDTRRSKVRESEGIGVAFQKFIESYQPKHGTPITEVSAIVSKMSLW